MFGSIPREEAVALAFAGWREREAHGPLPCTELSADGLAGLLAKSLERTEVVLTVDGTNRFFRQTQGLSMGKSFSPPLADLYMRRWEADLDESAAEAGGQIAFACRYCDDYLLGWRGNREQAELFLDIRNRKHQAIQVTMEWEVDGSIPYLDLQITRTRTGFQTAVFRKGSFSGHCVPFSSYHDPRHLSSAISSEVARAHRYCSTPALLKTELSFIRGKFLANRWPEVYVRSEMARASACWAARAAEERAGPRLPRLAEGDLYFSVPYWGDVFQMLRREASRLLGIRVVARSSGTLGNCLGAKQKTQLSAAQSSGVVYRFSCSCGGYYWGETGRELRTRVAEHQTAANENRSALAPHKAECNPGPNFQIAEREDWAGEAEEGGSESGARAVPPVRIVSRQPHPAKRKILEGAFISVAEKTQRRVIRDTANLNRDAGWAPDEAFLPAFTKAISPLL